MVSNTYFTQVRLQYTIKLLTKKIKQRYGWLNPFVKNSQRPIIQFKSIDSTNRWDY